MRKLGQIKSTGTAGTYIGHSVASAWGALGGHTGGNRQEEQGYSFT